MKKTPHPLALIILDGWGHRDAPDANAIAAAHKPYWDYLWQHYAHTLISGSGRCVGLPDGQMGNSEVGHLNMGAGRIVHQDLTRIDQAIEDGSFFTNPTLTRAIDKAMTSGKAIHLIGLLSPGGVHSHEKHFHALLKLAAERGAKKVYVHAFLDGRDTPPQSAESSLAELDAYCKTLSCGAIASIIGRYYAMDRDKRWERVHQAYDLLTLGKADFYAKDALTAVQQAYQRGETDEFVRATQILPVTVQEGDSIIFMNFRADRARQLTSAFTLKTFSGFARACIPALSDFICLTEYDANLPAELVFAPEQLSNIFPDYISQQGFSQLRIAETEKYAHVTFFFNGGIETPYPGEDRILIPSPKVATYDLQPEMSAPELTDRLITEIKSQRYDVIICNFANPDMLGHTGNMPATTKAIETIDACLAKIIPALQAVGGEALITADHGNAEMMFDHGTRQPHTAHTCEKVPFIYVGRDAHIVKSNGKLSDIAPTMLYLMGLPIPAEMTGSTLLELD